MGWQNEVCQAAGHPNLVFHRSAWLKTNLAEQFGHLKLGEGHLSIDESRCFFPSLLVGSSCGSHMKRY